VTENDLIGRTKKFSYPHHREAFDAYIMLETRAGSNRRSKKWLAVTVDDIYRKG